MSDPDPGGDPAATPEGTSLGGTAARGALVTIGGQGGRLLLQLVGIAILARLLDPADYGLIAMVTVLVNLGEIFRDFGLSAAAVQSPTLPRGARDNLFWANTLLGVALYAVSLIVAPLIADFFDQDALVSITRVLALVFILNGLATQFRANLTRDLQFGRIAGAEVASQAVGLVVGVATALGGWGYWALVIMQLTQAAAALALLWIFSGWVPGRPDRTVPMGDFWRYGVHLMGSQFLGFISNNVTTVVIGRRFGPDQLGIYDRANRLLMVPLAQIRTPATTVALPVLSRLNTDQARYGDFLCRAQVALGYTLIPALAVVAGAATPLVAVFLGPQWSESAPILALLAISGALQTLSFVGYWVYLSRALTHRLLQYSVISMVVRVSFVVIGSQWGVLGVAAGVALAPAVLWPLSLWWLSRLTEIPVRRLVAGATRILILAACGGAAAYAAVNVAGSLDAVVQLALAVVACVVVYCLAALIPSVRRDEADVLEFRQIVRR